MTRQSHRRGRFAAGRPRTSTLVLIGLFVGVLALYYLVRPVTAAEQAPAGNVQQKTYPAHTEAPATSFSHTATRSPAATTRPPTPSHSPSASRTPSPSHTPTTTPAATPTISATAQATSPTGSPAA